MGVSVQFPGQSTPFVLCVGDFCARLHTLQFKECCHFGRLPVLGWGDSMTRGLEMVTYSEWFEELEFDVLGSEGRQGCYIKLLSAYHAEVLFYP